MGIKTDTVWWCVRCHASGRLLLPEMLIADAMARLMEDHDGHELATHFSCQKDYRFIRVTITPYTGSDGPNA